MLPGTKIMMASLAICLALTGCSTFNNYPKTMETPLSAIRANDLKTAEASFPKKPEADVDTLLFSFEKGTFEHACADFEASNQAFKNVYAAYEDKQIGPKISISDTSKSGGALLLNEKLRTYRPDAYERLYMHSLWAMNYLMMADKDEAKVEIRRGYEQAQIIKEDKEKELAALKEKAQKDKVDADSQNNSINTITQGVFTADELAAMQSNTVNPYENAYAHYLSGLVRELCGEYSDAYIDYENAYRVAPGSKLLQQQLAKAAKRADNRERCAEWEKKFGPAQSPAEDEGELFLAFQCGLAAHKEEVRLTLPIPIQDPETGAMTVVLAPAAFPKYNKTNSRAACLEVMCDGQSLGKTETLADMDAIALRNFSDEMPRLVLRQVLRSAGKAATDYAAMKQGGALSGLVKIMNQITEQADLRSCLCAPANLQAMRFSLPEGEHNIELALLDSSGAVIDQKNYAVTIAAGKITVINARGIDSFVGDAQVSQPI